MKATNEIVQFRLLHMPCCGIPLCWVNPQRPNTCPECGKGVLHLFPRERWDATYSPATLRIADNYKAQYFCD